MISVVVWVTLCFWFVPFDLLWVWFVAVGFLLLWCVSDLSLVWLRVMIDLCY